MSPEKGYKCDPRDGTPSLQEQSERAEAVQPGEKKAQKRPDSGLPMSKMDL